MYNLKRKITLINNFRLLGYNNMLNTLNYDFLILNNNNLSSFKIYGKFYKDKNRVLFNSYDYSISNSIISSLSMRSNGLKAGYFIELILKGIGFKVFQFGDKLFFQLGYSHFYVYENKIKDVLIKAKRDRILIFGFNKQQIGNVAYELSSLRKPDAYKAKGIQFKNKVYILKEGKKK
jgi:ribosomal protein L6P/L9E